MLENLLQETLEVIADVDVKVEEMSRMPSNTFKDKVLFFTSGEISKLVKEAPRLLGGESQDVSVFIGKLDILERLMDLIEDN